MAEVEDRLIVWGPYSGVHPRGIGAGKIFVSWQSGIYPQKKVNYSFLNKKGLEFAKFTILIEDIKKYKK